jgi:hypothetical protein
MKVCCPSAVSEDMSGHAKPRKRLDAHRKLSPERVPPGRREQVQLVLYLSFDILIHQER